ncbi:bifunctional diguanylate cyclase/phosphodiesterase [Rhodobacteraceae bacterium D3-12]|nr:bifunctional diguanylate cyclase/phosphodiesterase [Rhodobacteraceae bacterium D3-12]
MARRNLIPLSTARAILRRMLSGPQVLAFLPAIVLGAYWTGGEGALFLVALGVPLLVMLAGGFERLGGPGAEPIDSVTGLPLAETLETRLEDTLARANTRGFKSACFILQIEDLNALQNRLGVDAAERVLDHCASRLRGVLRDGDHLGWLGDSSFGITLHATANLDLEGAIQLASRIQDAAEDPVFISGSAVYISASVGFCMSHRAPNRTARSMLHAAAVALDEARRNGPSAIRAFSGEMGKTRANRETLRDDALRALENGEIEPWFQPQVSTDTGQITGFEALARWIHPKRGTVPAVEFLPVLEQSGQMERLGEVILYGALQALNAWDAAELDVPRVAVNFTGEELRNPKLVEKICWDLDRFDLTADRLTVEILETVVVGAPEDTATQNIFKLAELGCRIDLDDFGTGNASIAAIRRFAIERIKIDRSFITHVDDDPEQQRMVAAILSMAERLGLDTLAEGVETSGEHTMLAQLGCRHVQGYGIARPMPLVQTFTWLEDHRAKLAPPPTIGRTSG